MRLKLSRVDAEEELTRELAEGQLIVSLLAEADGMRRQGRLTQKEYDEATATYGGLLQSWVGRVAKALSGIFPTVLEEYKFRNALPSGVVRAGSSSRSPEPQARAYVAALDDILRNSLGRYTDLPVKDCLFVEDIDSFRKVRDINPAVVAPLLQEGGYLDVPEDFVQRGLETILSEAFHKRDWGGELNDLYSTNLLVNGARVATAFLLKGNGLKKREMQLSDCGKNGDQVQRLFESPAKLFVIQFVGRVSEAVTKDAAKNVELLRGQGKEAWYCIINGQDTARILIAYGVLTPPP